MDRPIVKFLIAVLVLGLIGSYACDKHREKQRQMIIEVLEHEVNQNIIQMKSDLDAGTDSRMTFQNVKNFPMRMWVFKISKANMNMFESFQEKLVPRRKDMDWHGNTLVIEVDKEDIEQRLKALYELKAFIARAKANENNFDF